MNSARPVPSSDLGPVPETYAPGQSPYYVAYGSACDWIQRCDDCKTLVTLETIHRDGGCHKCGCRKFKEPRTLSVWEFIKIKIGLLQFPHADEFLAAFKANGGGA